VKWQRIDNYTMESYPWRVCKMESGKVHYHVWKKTNKWEPWFDDKFNSFNAAKKAIEGV
tara:strand:+ start:1540 stop:1716 length:177 start_codon:yes stop_codon:yes gene_type:complete